LTPFHCRHAPLFTIPPTDPLSPRLRPLDFTSPFTAESGSESAMPHAHTPTRTIPRSHSPSFSSTASPTRSDQSAQPTPPNVLKTIPYVRHLHCFLPAAPSSCSIFLPPPHPSSLLTQPDHFTNTNNGSLRLRHDQPGVVPLCGGVQCHCDAPGAEAA
jgi:hypothetical protein